MRRSPRIKSSKKGFKDPVCKDKNCLGCNTNPPTLSSKMIRKLGSTLCDLDAPLVTDEALNRKKKKNEAPSKKKKKTTPVGSAPSKADEDQDVDEDVARNKKKKNEASSKNKKKAAPVGAAFPKTDDGQDGEDDDGQDEA